MAKTFKNAAMNFISAEEPTTTPRADDPAGAQIPKGYKLVKESKSARTQILLRPATKEALREAAEEQGISLNELINTVLDSYIEGKGNA